MSANTYLIEALQRTIKELSVATLNTADKTVLANLAKTDTFVKLFSLPEESSTQLTERQLSELTNYQFNTVVVARKIMEAYGHWGVTTDGATYSKAWHISGHRHLPPRDVVVFRLIDKGNELRSTETHLAIFKLVNQDTKEVYTVNFEVADTLTGSDLFDIIKSMLPNQFDITVKSV